MPESPKRRLSGSDLGVGTLNFGASSIIGRRKLLGLTAGMGLTDNAPDYSVGISFAVPFNTPPLLSLGPPGAEIPHIGMLRPIFALLAEPGIGSLQEIIVRQCGEADAHRVRDERRPSEFHNEVEWPPGFAVSGRPSSAARRMAETAAHLVDHVIPREGSVSGIVIPDPASMQSALCQTTDDSALPQSL